jgi:hypothetical protein
MKYLDLDLIENPYGKRIGGGYETVLTGGGDRSHIKGDNGKPLCMQKVSARDVRPSSARTVTCYRCIKIMGMNSNAPFVTRNLTPSHGERKKHLMVPGGRQGRMVADKKASPYGETGAAPFKRGPANHPTQPWMTTRVVRAKTREERLREEGIALPIGYTPPTFAESWETTTAYVSPKARRRREAKQVAALIAERARPPAVMVDAFGEPFTMDDVRKVVGEDERMMRENPRRRNAGQAAEAMNLYHSGQASSLAEAWDIVRGGAARPRKRTLMERAVYRPRTGAANAQNAAEAMKLFHSGQASSLAEAWQMVKGQRTNPYRRFR